MIKKLNDVDADRALKLRQRDTRARALAMSCVAYAMNEEPGNDVPSDARHYAHDVATLATALLVSQIYLDDAELRALKEENEQLRKMALNYATTHAPQYVVPRWSMAPRSGGKRRFAGPSGLPSAVGEAETPTRSRQSNKPGREM